MTEPAVTDRVAFVGVGAMGGPMLRRMVQACRPDAVSAFDTDVALAERICADTGAVQRSTLRDIAQNAEFVITCLPDNDIVRQVYLGENGLATFLPSGSVTIDCSTIGPEISREIAEKLARRGAGHLDASMLGSVKQANEGTISFVVGGKDETFERARPLLGVLGGMIRHCGPSGAGNAMKLLHQILVASHAVAASEAIAACETTGVSPQAFFEVVVNGTGLAHSRYFELRIPRAMEGNFSPLFMLKLMAKDARLAKAMLPDSAPESGYTVLDAAIGALEAAEFADLGEEDFSAVLKVARQRWRGDVR